MAGSGLEALPVDQAGVDPGAQASLFAAAVDE